MSEPPSPEVGGIGWVDLTVADAEGIRDFYAQVVGWKPQALDMGGYSDFVMSAPGSGEGKAGVCHARGGNAAIPPVWLVYLMVEDLDASVARCEQLGGKVLAPARSAGPSGRFCVIQDPAGAVAALFQG
jgi:predicted enzyme related to lactoylglutathione lyase